MKYLLISVLALVLFSCDKQKEPYEHHIIPEPVSLVNMDDEFKISSKTVINCQSEDEDILFAAEYLNKLVNDRYHLTLEVNTSKKINKGIVLSIDTSIKAVEGYELEVNNASIIIKGATAAGLFYGVQTLRQMLPTEHLHSNEVIVRGISIEDYPRFKYRGMHLDVSRHFYSVDYIKRFIDGLAHYKFNSFHWHLTDDQGWRIEIKKYPELTAKGAFRKLNGHDRNCMERAKTDSSMYIQPELLRLVEGDTIYGGFYTQEDVKEIIKYATQRNIQIIPEIDMPGHFSAAIKNYPYLSCTGKAAWQSVFSAPLCAGNERTYTFVEDVLSEVVDLFPSEYVHIGADEVQKDTWKKCKKCQGMINKQGLHNEHDLQSYFVKRMEKFLNEKGKKVIGWDEILEGGMSKTATMMYWRGWMPNAPKQAVEQQNEVIMTPTSHSYFDYDYNAISTQKAYEWKVIPDNIKKEDQKYIIGGQANIWTEFIPNEARADYMHLPRMMGMAEALWTPLEKKSWDRFKTKLNKHYQILDDAGRFYHMEDYQNNSDRIVFTESFVLDLPSLSANFSYKITSPDGKEFIKSTIDFEPIEFTKSGAISIQTISKNGYKGPVQNILIIKEKAWKAKSIATRKINCKVFSNKKFNTVEEVLSMQTCSQEMTVDSIAIPEVAQGESRFGLLFTGMIEVPQTGVYEFSSKCDDAGRLAINEQDIVNNLNGKWNITKTGQIVLEKGAHPFTFIMFQGTGGSSISLAYRLKGGEYQPFNVLLEKK